MIKITKKDLSWSYLAEILQFGSNLFILPLILRSLESKELAIWFIYLAISRLVSLFDFGFQGNIMRNITYIYSGARELKKTGIIEVVSDNQIDYNLLKSIIRAVKSIYFIIAGLTFIFLIFGGSYYINDITNGIVLDKKIIYSWLIMVLSITLNIYYLYYTAFLIGRGLVKENKKASIYSNVVYLFISILLLSLGYGLVGISFAFLTQSLTLRLFSYKYFYDSALIYSLKNATYSLNKKEAFSVLWSNSWKMGVVSLGAFLILQANTLILPKYESLLVVAQYGLTLQIINFLYRISLIHFNTIYPQLTSNRINSNRNEIIKLLGTSYTIFSCTFLVGAIGLLFFGNTILVMIGSNTYLFSFNMLAVMLLMFLLEANHSIAAIIITSKNEVPFYFSSLITGIAIVTFSLILFQYTHIGIWAIVVSQFLVQLSYNNWRWPIFVLKDFNTSYLELFTAGYKSIKKQIKWV
jgi:O-antigen/teichoic acid export membrane protein